MIFPKDYVIPNIVPIYYLSYTKGKQGQLTAPYNE